MNAEKHPFKPIFDKHSKVLILGSFPPRQTSQKVNFYYADGRKNRFWGVLSRLFNEPKLSKMPNNEKEKFLKDHKIALWDIWAVCYKNDLDSANDDTIVAEKSHKVDLTELLETAQIEKIYTVIGNSFEKWGVEAWLWDNYASKYFPHCKTPSEFIVPLCSTSGVTRRSYVDLIEKYNYKQIAEFLEPFLKQN